MSSNLPICPHCGGEPVLWQERNGNGAHVVTARCHKCNRFVNSRQMYLPKSEHPNWEKYPLYEDRMQYSQPCAVKGCDRRDTEYHHFAPIALFGMEADDYPGAYLCQYHHDHWHELTKTGKWTRRKHESISN